MHLLLPSAVDNSMCCNRHLINSIDTVAPLKATCAGVLPAQRQAICKSVRKQHSHTLRDQPKELLQTGASVDIERLPEVNSLEMVDTQFAMLAPSLGACDKMPPASPARFPQMQPTKEAMQGSMPLWLSLFRLPMKCTGKRCCCNCPVCLRQATNKSARSSTSAPSSRPTRDYPSTLQIICKGCLHQWCECAMASTERRSRVSAGGERVTAFQTRKAHSRRFE